MDGILSTLVDLAKLGAVGVVVAIALLVAVLIFKLKSLDAATAALVEKMMRWGFGLALVFGLFTLVPLFIDPPAEPVKVRIAFSPNFATQGLTSPVVELPDGSAARPGQVFLLQASATPHVLNVGVDKTLADVRELRQATATLAASVKTISEQRDALATSIAPAPAVEDNLMQSSAQTDELSRALATSVNTGDYQRVNRLSKELRSVVVSADRPVATIARPSR